MVHVLVADDDKNTRRLLRAVQTSGTVRVTVKNDGPAEGPDKRHGAERPAAA